MSSIKNIIESVNTENKDTILEVLEFVLEDGYCPQESALEWLLADVDLELKKHLFDLDLKVNKAHGHRLFKLLDIAPGTVLKLISHNLSAYGEQLYLLLENACCVDDKKTALFLLNNIHDQLRADTTFLNNSDKMYFLSADDEEIKLTHALLMKVFQDTQRVENFISTRRMEAEAV